MARRRKQKQPAWAAAAVLIVAVLAAALHVFGGPAPVSAEPSAPADSGREAVSPESSASGAAGETRVYFLDVGQGDCELLRLGTGETVLIDSGTGESAQELTAYLKELGVGRIDFLIATHPHEDHIGGMTAVVEQFPVGKIYMPRIADGQVPTTATYRTLLQAIDRKNLRVTAARGGMTVLSSGENRLELFAPNRAEYDNLNNYSVVAKLTCGEKRFLFTGDAETQAEQDLLKRKYDLRSDVLKCGHHGSSTSTGAAFLKAVSPAAAVISCGLNNDYGHPSPKVVQRLQKAGVTIYRTDRQGTILARCDGKTVRFSSGLKSVLPKAA